MERTRLTNAGPLGIALCLFVGVTALTCIAVTRPRVGGDAHATPPIWAGITVDRPLVEVGSHTSVSLTLTLVNDTDSFVNPELGRAQLVINGREWSGSAMAFGNGPRDDRFEKLPAGDYLLLSFGVTGAFAEPGVYRVQWRGPRFESEPVTFRVLERRLDVP